MVTKKRALVNFDDNRLAIDDVNILAWGHNNTPGEIVNILNEKKN